jgi:hypothetical protein
MTPKELVNLPNNEIIDFFRSYKISSRLENFELNINLGINCKYKLVHQIDNDLAMPITLYSNIGNIGKGRILKKIGIISATVKINHKYYPKLEIQVFPVGITVSFFNKQVRAEFVGGEVVRIYKEGTEYNYFIKQSVPFSSLIYYKKT